MHNLALLPLDTLQGPAISVVVPTYRREQVLLDTLQLVNQLMGPGDEVVVVDQTAQHEPATEEGLRRLTAVGAVRWYRSTRPHIAAAMNAGALLARNGVLLFLDDDIIPAPSLLEAHRSLWARQQTPPAVCGQVLQPWHQVPVRSVKDYAEGFDAAYAEPCDILSLMGGNFSIDRETFLDLGGIDENFFGAAYRWEAELCYRIFRKTGRKVRFLPEASIRHLQAAAGGTRSHGTKDTWRHISGSVGDYYFAMKCLPPARALRHCLRRLFRAPINRATIRRPWLVPSLFVREIVAWGWALGLLPQRERNYIKPASNYVVREPAAGSSGEVRP